MFTKIKNAFLNILSGNKIERDERNDDIVLKIVARDEIIAFLTTITENEVTKFSLTYTKAFENAGVPPFNLDKDAKPEIGREYKSEVLWYSFAARLPSPKRVDFEEEARKAGLKGNEPILEVIGRLGKHSISKSWTLDFESHAA